MRLRTRLKWSEAIIFWGALSYLAALTLGCATQEAVPPPPPPPPTISSVSVSPGAATVEVGATQQFTATVQGTGNFNPAVRWLVNDVEGGNSAVGTITSTGLYTGPASLPDPNTVSVKAVSVADASKSATASITLSDIPFKPDSGFREVTEAEEIDRGDGTIALAAANEVLIGTTEDITRSELSALKNKILTMGGVIVGSSAELRMIQVRIASSASEAQFMSELRSFPGVLTAHLNEFVPFLQDNRAGYQRYLSSRKPGPATMQQENVLAADQTCDEKPDPKDDQPFAGCYWVNHIRAQEAWKITRGTATPESAIAIVDTGVSAEQQVLDEARLKRYVVGGNSQLVATSDDDTKDRKDHGLRVTGFAAGNSDKATGVAQNNLVYSIDIYRLKQALLDKTLCFLFGQHCASYTDGYAGLWWAIIPTSQGGLGAFAANASWGGCGGDKVGNKDDEKRELIHQDRYGKTAAVVAARRNDALIVFGAGNCQYHADNKLFYDPGDFGDLEKKRDLPKPNDEDALDAWQDNAILVAATNNQDKLWSRSVSGNVVEIAAPGEDVGFGITTTQSGTSFSAPLVTGTVGLMRSVAPTLSAPEVKRILLDTATPLEGTTGTNRLLNAGAAVANARDLSGIPLVSRSVQLTKGQKQTVSFDVQVPAAGPPLIDVFFLVDVTGSYADDIASLQSRANQVITDLVSRGGDVRFGVASFADFPFFPFGDFLAGDQAFFLNQPLTADVGAVINAINNLDNPLRFGGDPPESQLEALYQLATGAGRDLNGDGDFDDPGELRPVAPGWRTGALKIIILATDARFHDPENEAYPCTGCSAATRRDALEALEKQNITVIGLNSGDAFEDLNSITSKTSGVTLNLSSDSREIAEAIIGAVSAKLARVNLSLKVVNESGKAWIDGDVKALPAFAGVLRGETKTFVIPLQGTKKSGQLEQKYFLYLWVLENDSAVIQRIRIEIEVPKES